MYKSMSQRIRLLNLLQFKPKGFGKKTDTHTQKKNYLQVNERLICILPEAVEALVTNEQPTAVRRAKPGRRNPSSVCRSARAKSTGGSGGDGHPFQLSRVSLLSSYRRSDSFLKLSFVFI